MEIIEFRHDLLDEVVSIHCPNWEEMTFDLRIKECGYWGDPQVFGWYLEALYSSGGKAIVALSDGKVVGEAEVVPERFLTPVGEHAYLQMVWVKEEARRTGVGRKLVERCMELAREMGMRHLDTIPTAEALPFFESLGFREIDSQVLMEAPARPAPEQPKVEDATRDEFPAAAQMIAGQTRPSSLLWELLWDRDSVGLPSPRVVKVRVGLWQLILAMFQPTRDDDHLYALIWGPRRASLGQIFDSAEMAVTLAHEMGVPKVVTQTWCKYRAAFEAAGFEPVSRYKWMRKEI